MGRSALLAHRIWAITRTVERNAPSGVGVGSRQANPGSWVGWRCRGYPQTWTTTPPGCATACDRLRHADVGPHNGTQSSRPSGPPPRRMRCPLATALPGAERGHIVPPGSPRRMGCGSRGRVSTARGFGGTPQRHLGSGACRFTSGCPESGRIAAGTRDRPGGCCLQRCTSTGSGDRSVRRLAAKHG